MSALDNEDTDENHQEIIRVANDIRKEHGDLSPHESHNILNLYWDYLATPNGHKTAFLNAISPLDHLDTFDWLVQRQGSRDSDSLTHAYIRSSLLEGAGRRDEALAGFRSIQTRSGPNISATLSPMVSAKLSSASPPPDRVASNISLTRQRPEAHPRSRRESDSG